MCPCVGVVGWFSDCVGVTGWMSGGVRVDVSLFWGWPGGCVPSVRGLKLLVYEVLSYLCMRP